MWLAENSACAPAIHPDTPLGSPIARPSKIICIGLNYSDHAAESKMEVPKEPVVFFKATTAMTGPNNGLQITQGSEKTDREVELAVVIGRTARSVSEAQAMEHVAGYMLHNHYSECAWLLERGGQWVKGKSADTFAPFGRWLATRDEIPDPDRLRLRLSVKKWLIPTPKRLWTLPLKVGTRGPLVRSLQNGHAGRVSLPDDRHS